MARSLASPSFMTGPQDDLAAPDIYTISNAETINKVAPFAVMEDVKVQQVSALQGGKAMLEKTRDSLKLAQSVQGLNAKGTGVFDKLMSSSGSLSNVVRNLPSGAGGLSKELGVLVGAASSVVQKGTGAVAQINGMKQTFSLLKSGDAFTKIDSIGNMINALSSDSGIFSISNIQEKASSIAGVVNLAAENGIKGAFGAVLKDSTDSPLLNKVAAACLPTTVATSDLASLSSMASSVKPGVIKGINPTVLGDFTTSFALPAEATTSVIKGQFDEVTKTFDKIDPSWNKASFGGEDITNVSCVVGGSKDFNMMLSRSIMTNPDATDKEHAMLAATLVEPTDVHKELQTQFPLMTSLQSSAPAAVVSPISLPNRDPLPTTPVVSVSAVGLASTKVWSSDDEAVVVEIAKRMKLATNDPKLKDYGWIQWAWNANKINQKERYTLERRP